MRKLLLLFSAVLTLGASAQTKPVFFEKSIGNTNNKLAMTTNKSISKAEDDGFTIQFCDEVYNWTRFSDQSNITYKCYIYITPDMATTIAGNKITEISFSCAANASATKQGTVFVTENINDTPTTSTACTVVNSYGANPEFQTIALEEPYTIKENTGFYFGYTVEGCNTSYFPVGFDYKDPSEFSGTVQLLSSAGKSIATYDMGKEVGNNMFLTAKAVGEAKGFKDCFLLGNLSLGYFTLPVVNVNSLGNLLLPIENIGFNALTSVEYSIDLNGVAGETTTLGVNVPGGKTDYLEIPAPAVATGKNDFTINIKKLNGIEKPSTSSARCLAIANDGYERMFVVEEGTGTWCGYCPRGIVGLDKMSQKYPEKFIGIAIHNGDKMAVSSYQTIINKYFEGFPSCIINRDPLYNVDPNFDMLELCYSGNFYWGQQRAAANVDMEVELKADNGFNVKTNTTFAFNENNADYRLAFVIVEDGLTGNQTNYYAGGSKGKMDGWENKASTVSWVFENTARDIFDPLGIENSLPSTITVDEPMAFETTISGSNVTDPMQTAVIALILDAETGTILNATRVKAENYTKETVGIKDITNSTGKAEYFSLNGMRVDNPAKGTVVIRRQDGKMSKMVIR